MSLISYGCIWLGLKEIKIKMKPITNLIKTIKRKIGIFALAGSILISSGCSYKTLLPDSIKPVRPIIQRPIKELLNKPQMDYSKLIWQEAIEHVQLPVKAQNYLDNHLSEDEDEANAKFDIWVPGIIYKGGIIGETFKHNHKKRKGICLDYATSAAALLSDNGYPPLILDMRNRTKRHSVFLYKTEEGFSALGNTPMFQSYATVEDLVKDFAEMYGKDYDFDKYFVVNLDDNHKNREWISGNINLMKNMPANKYIRIK